MTSSLVKFVTLLNYFPSLTVRLRVKLNNEIINPSACQYFLCEMKRLLPTTIISYAT